MKKFIIISILFVIISSLFAGSYNEGYIPGKLIIKVKTLFNTITKDSQNRVMTGQPWFDSLSVQFNITQIRKISDIQDTGAFSHLYVCSFSENTDLITIKDAFTAKSGIDTAFRDSWLHLNTNDPYWNQQGYMTQINLPQDLTTANYPNQNNIIVAFIGFRNQLL